VSRRTNQWKTENDIPTLEWPPQSPDLNIIENVWKVIKTKIQR
jgi:transposase